MNEEHEESKGEQRDHTRMRALLNEAEAHYRAQGIPPEEIDEQTVFDYASERLTDAEAAALGLPTREEFPHLFLEAMIVYRHAEVGAERGWPPLLPNPDPEREQLIQEIAASIRERDEAEAYWEDDEDEQE